MITILKISGRFNEIKKDMMSLKISSLWKRKIEDKNESHGPHCADHDRKFRS